MKHLVLTSSIALAFFSASAAHAAGNGQLDPKFSGDGMNSANFGTPSDLHDTPFAQVNGPGGSTYVVGTASVDTNPTSFVLAIAKFQPNGTLDPTYGNGGRVLREFAGDVGGIGGAGITADGALVIGTTISPAASDSEDFGVVCRFGKTGKIDPTFADAGCMELRPTWIDPDGSVESHVASLAIRRDGAILAGGTFAQTDFFSDPGIAAILPDGSGLDTSFGEDGIVHFPDTTQDIENLQLASGGTVMGSSYFGSQIGNRSVLIKVDSDSGEPAANFGTQGMLTLELPLLYPHQLVEAFDVSGVGQSTSIFLVGESWENFGNRTFIAKLSASGQLDPQFADAGVLEFDADTPVGQNLCAIMIVNDGVVVAGQGSTSVSSTPTWSAIKLNGSGGVQLNFGDEGESVLPLRYEACNLGEQGGRLVLSGRSDGSVGPLKPNRFHVARLDHGLASVFPVTPTAGANGTITPSQPVVTSHSDVAEFKVVPKFGFRIASVTGCGNGELIGTRYRTGPVTTACAVKATFEKIPITP